MSKKPNFIVRFEEVQRIDVKVFAKDEDDARSKAMSDASVDWQYAKAKSQERIKEKTIVKIPKVAKIS